MFSICLRVVGALTPLLVAQTVNAQAQPTAASHPTTSVHTTQQPTRQVNAAGRELEHIRAKVEAMRAATHQAEVRAQRAEKQLHDIATQLKRAKARSQSLNKHRSQVEGLLNDARTSNPTLASPAAVNTAVPPKKATPEKASQ